MRGSVLGVGADWAVRTKAVAWTVEWICGPQVTMQHSVSDNVAVSLSYQTHLGELENTSGKAKSDHESVSVSSVRESQDDAHCSSSEYAMKADSPSNMHFYLHVPSQSFGNKKALLPIDGNTPLRQALRDQTVIEFPTIFVMATPPDQLDTTAFRRCIIDKGAHNHMTQPNQATSLKRTAAQLEDDSSSTEHASTRSRH